MNGMLYLCPNSLLFYVSKRICFEWKTDHEFFEDSFDTWEILRFRYCSWNFITISPSASHILPSKKQKLIWSTNMQSNRSKNEKVTVNTKYCCEHQCTCNILMFTYLMMSKMIYLLMDWKKCNLLVALE